MHNAPGTGCCTVSPDIKELSRLTAWHAVPLITGLSERSTKHRTQDLHVSRPQQGPSLPLTVQIGCRVQVTAICSYHWTLQGRAAEHPLDGANILQLSSLHNVLQRYGQLTVPIPQPKVITPIALA